MSSQLLETAATHPFSLVGLADSVWNVVSERAIRASWGPVTRVAESAVLSLLQNISAGHLRVHTTNGQVHDFPSSKASENGATAEIRVRNDAFWLRLCLMGDLGFSEAYMYGEVQCDDLVALFRVFLMNKQQLERLDSSWSFLFTLPQKLTSYRFLNTLSNSRSNISAHYDISNEMFKGFLSQEMTYSCAIFSDLDGDSKPPPTGDAYQPTRDRREPTQIPSPPLSDTPSLSTSETDSPGTTNSPRANSVANVDEQLLERKLAAEVHESQEDALYLAQLRKLDHIIDKLKIPSEKPTRVLEIGSGWGSMAIRIAERYPLATIDTLTLSVQQQQLARERIALRGSGIAERIEVHLMDYRAMPREWEASFDRVVSVEMIEAVGREFLEVYWKAVDWAMKKEDAAGVVQVITLPEARFEKYVREIDFIRKWVRAGTSMVIDEVLAHISPFYRVIFPGGFLPTVSLLVDSLRAGSNGRLVVDCVSNIGPHYARTLREWCRRFTDHFDDVIKPALMEEHPAVMGAQRPDGNMQKAEEEIEVFRRKWIYYYRYCEVGFSTRTLGDHIITFTREGFEAYGCGHF